MHTDILFWTLQSACEQFGTKVDFLIGFSIKICNYVMYGNKSTYKMPDNEPVTHMWVITMQLCCRTYLILLMAKDSEFKS